MWILETILFGNLILVKSRLNSAENFDLLLTY